tara:strand:+ start:215 stop:421 length:207 start_codon:yes stop_codon:yes gene_type:complete
MVRRNKMKRWVEKIQVFGVTKLDEKIVRAKALAWDKMYLDANKEDSIISSDFWVETMDIYLEESSDEI